MTSPTVVFVSGMILCQVLFWSCAKDNSKSLSKNDGTSQFEQYQHLEIDSETGAKSMVKNGRVYCESTNPSDCPPSVGLLSFLTPSQGAGQCTAFLVSPQIAMTNSHCIPKDLKSPGSDCSERMWLYFPDVPGYGQLRVGCSQVLAASTLPEKQKFATPDYALILLDQRVNRPPLEISREGIKDGKDYQVVKVDPRDTHAVTGAMKRVTCKSIHNSALMPNSSFDESPMMSLNDCEIMHGNSGSPILDSDGKAVGLIQLFFEQKVLDDYRVKNSGLIADTQIAQLNGGTNLACLDLPSEVSAPFKAEKCAKIASSQGSENAQLYAILIEEMKRLSFTMNPVFRWSILSLQDSNATKTDTKSNDWPLLLVPYCVQNANALLQNQREQAEKYKTKAEMHLSSLTTTIKIELNRYLVPRYLLTGPTRIVNATLSYSPEELVKNKKTKVALSQIDGLGSNPPSFNPSLGICPAN